MPGITESDQELRTELQALLDQLNAMQHNLYTRRPGCACDEKQLCALHAAVYSHLWDASIKIDLAIGQLESEG